MLGGDLNSFEHLLRNSVHVDRQIGLQLAFENMAIQYLTCLAIFPSVSFGTLTTVVVNFVGTGSTILTPVRLTVIDIYSRKKQKL